MEIWIKTKQYPEDYEVSNLGNVRSTLKVINKTDGTTYKRVSKVLRPANRNGYLVVGLSKMKQLKSYLVHRLVAEAFIPNPENKKEVNHKDGNKLNNTIDNLEWVTRRENLNHAVLNGFVAVNKGEKNGNSKLTQEIVNQIRETYKPKQFGLVKTARLFGISKRNVLDIIKKRIWK